MTVQEILVAAQLRGVALRPDGDAIAFSAPRGALTPELRAAIVAHKAALLTFLRGGELAAPAPIPRTPAADDEPSPLSASQARLWFLDRLAPDSPMYNSHIGLRMPGPLDRAALQAALTGAAARHPMIRAVFPEHKGHPSLVVSPARAWDVPVVDLRRLPAAERQAELARRSRNDAVARFDLARGPLLRTTLIALAEDDHVLFLTHHHIITDGWSLGVLLRDLAELYQASRDGRPPALAEPALRYIDFTRWQSTALHGDELARSAAWWRQHLAGLPRLELAVARAPGTSPRHAGDACSFVLSPELTAALKELARRESCTLFVVLLAVWAALLHGYSHQIDFGIGTVAACRDRSELCDVYGLFVNTLVLRCDLSGDPDGVTLLRRLREIVAGALRHQELPFDRIVSVTGAPRTSDLNSLFRASLVLENMPFPALGVPGLSWRLMTQRVDAGPPGTAKFELGLTLMEIDGALSATIEYATALFDAATIETMVREFQVLATHLVTAPRQRLSRLVAAATSNHPTMKDDP